VNQTGVAFRSVVASPSLRRLELAALGSNIGDWAYGVALAVYAYDQGGAYAVGLTVLARTGAAAIVATPAAALVDRFDRRRVMVAADLVRCVLVAIVAVLALAGHPLAVYSVAVLATMAGVVFEPARAAVMPAVAENPEQLTAANVVHATVLGVATFMGPAIGGLLIAAFQPAVAFGFQSLTFLWSAALVAGVRLVAKPESPAEEGEHTGILAGLRLVLRDPHLRLLQGLFTLQTMICGFLNVFTVVIAFQLLNGGAVDAGLLDAAAGVGGIAGALAGAALVGRRLSAGFVIGLIGWGLPIAVIALAPSRPLALLMMATLGIANTLVDVAGLTLLQRLVPDEVMGRVFGVTEALFIGSIGLGSVLAPVCIGALGAREAIFVVGMLLPVAAVLSWRPLSRVDAQPDPRAVIVETLRGVPFLAPLEDAALERLAVAAELVSVPAGTEVIAEGAVGDRFYVVRDGTLAVSARGEESHELGAGDGFGEIALLRDVPRTATVTATTPCDLVAVEREPFLEAVTGFDESGQEAELLITARLARLRAIAVAG
jgi:MFS family permease